MRVNGIRRCIACGSPFDNSDKEKTLCRYCENALERMNGHVALVVHGQWLQGYPIHCSVCGGYAATEYEDANVYEAWLSPYCPHCGAKMDA